MKKSFFEKNVCHTGTSNGGKSGKWHFFKRDQIRVHLKKSFFEKNMCHTGTSNGGKKWQMALFQVGSKNNTSIWDTAKKKSEKQNLSD